MHRRILIGTAGALAVLVAALAAAVYLRSQSQAVVVVPPTAAPTVAATPTATPEPTATASATPTPTATATPEPTATASDGDVDVAALQQQLADLGYYEGAIDGEAGPATTSAVVAFQKVNELVADGVVGPLTQAALADPIEPSLQGGPPTRIEIDLTRQVLHYVADGTRVRTVPVSSGSGDSYETASGGTARSLTPVGQFTVERRIAGVREAPLGTLYDPLYFHRGWAIHGSNSVPSYPASHGCVRVTRADAVWLFERAPVGTPVHLYGGTHVFNPATSSAGTDTPAGDTPDTTPPDGIQTPEPTAPPPPPPTEPTPTQPPPTTEPSASPAPAPSEGPTGTEQPPAALPTTEPAGSPQAT